MLYLLGGTARSGKSTAAGMFLARTGIPYFCLDYLMMGFAIGLPKHGVDTDGDERDVGEKLWPAVKPMAIALLQDEKDYMIEGAQILPEFVVELAEADQGDFQACFLGFAESDAQAKFDQIREFGGDHDDWLKTYDDERAMAEVERLISWSVDLRAECERLDLPYFEVDLDVSRTAAEVVQYLTRAE